MNGFFKLNIIMKKNIKIIIKKINKNIENIEYFYNDYYKESEYKDDLIIKDLHYFLNFIFRYNYIILIIIVIILYIYKNT